jgi:hypothetical protein
VIWLIRIAVVGSVLAIGGVHLPVLVVVALLIAATVGLALWNDLLATPLPAPAIALLGLAGYTFFQALPLPYRVLEKLAPDNADVWGRALLPFGESAPHFASISLDPGASLLEGLKLLVYAGMVVLAASQGARRGATTGILLVFVSALLTATVTLGHGLLGATKVYGLYEPTFQPVPWHVGPLLNPNNLAGYLNLGAMCGLGLMLMRAPLLPPWLVGLGVAAIIGLGVVSASRGGFLALPMGMTGLALMLRYAPRLKSGRDSRLTTWLLMAAVGGGGMLALLGGNSQIWQELYDKNLGKLAMVGWMRPVIAAHRWFGIGRGSFESVFPAYRTIPGNIVYTHAENFPAQWITEWGVPVGVAAVLGLLWALRWKYVGAGRERLATAAWLGMATLLLQNLVDLGLEIPAVGIAFCMVLGLLWGDSARHRRKVQSAHGMTLARRRWAAASILVGGALIVILAARRGSNSVAEEKSRLHGRLSAGLRTRDDRLQYLASLRSAMLRHPAEPYFALLGAYVAQGAHENPIPWIERSLERGRVNGATHLLLAEVLGRVATRQALFELKLAVTDDPAQESAAARIAARISNSYDDLVSAIPDGETGTRMLVDLAMNTYSPTTPALTMALGKAALERDPALPSLRIVMAQDRIRHLAVHSDPNDPCYGDRRPSCEAEVEEQARMLDRVAPNESSSDQVRAQWLVSQGRAMEADRILAKRCPEVSDRASCLVQRASVDVTLNDAELMNKTAKELLVVSCGTTKSCADMSTWLGDLFAAHEQWANAVTHYRRAVRDAPSDSVWKKLAEAASGAGMHAAAIEAFERVAQLRGADETVNAALARERKLASDAVLAPR